MKIHYGKTKCMVVGSRPRLNTLEPEILYLAYLALEVTSPAIVGLNAFLASPNLP